MNSVCLSGGDVDMVEEGVTEDNNNLLARVSMSRVNSVRSRTGGGALSKTQEVSHLQSKYETEIQELR